MTNGSRQAVNKAWAILAKYLYKIELVLNQYPGLYYEVNKYFSSFFERTIAYSGVDYHLFLITCEYKLFKWIHVILQLTKATKFTLLYKHVSFLGFSIIECTM